MDDGKKSIDSASDSRLKISIDSDSIYIDVKTNRRNANHQFSFHDLLKSASHPSLLTGLQVWVCFGSDE